MLFKQDTCGECEAAAQRMHHGFTAGCRGCCARAAARSPQAHKARAAGDKFEGQYRRLLEQFGLTHNEVIAAHKADALGREPA